MSQDCNLHPKSCPQCGYKLKGDEVKCPRCAKILMQVSSCSGSCGSCQHGSGH